MSGRSEDSDQTGWMPRLIWVFAGCTLTLLVLSWGCSYVCMEKRIKTTPYLSFCGTDKDTAWQSTKVFQPQHDKTNKVTVRPVKTQINLGARPVWSESSLITRKKLVSLATHWAHSEDWSDWANAQADLSLRLAHTHFVGFVTSRLICNSGLPWKFDKLKIQKKKKIAATILKFEQMCLQMMANSVDPDQTAPQEQPTLGI